MHFARRNLRNAVLGRGVGVPNPGLRKRVEANSPEWVVIGGSGGAYSPATRACDGVPAVGTSASGENISAVRLAWCVPLECEHELARRTKDVCTRRTAETYKHA
jgi:hypothetical protein